MQLLLLWGGTILISIICDIIFTIDLIKSIAKEGYYIEDSKIENFYNKFADNGEEYIEKIKRFIPFVNIMNSFSYILERDNILRATDTYNFVRKMTPEEYERYKKNPSLKTLLEIMKENERKERVYCDYKDDNGEGKIYYETNGELTITKTTGSATKLTEEEQVKAVNKRIDELNKIVVELITGEKKEEDLKDLHEEEILYVKEAKELLEKDIEKDNKKNKQKTKNKRM